MTADVGEPMTDLVTGRRDPELFTAVHDRYFRDIHHGRHLAGQVADPGAAVLLGGYASSCPNTSPSVLGLGAEGHTSRNLRVRPDLVINLPAPRHCAAVERLAPLTGRDPVPPDKQGTFRYEPAKFRAAGFHPEPAELVRPPRVAECPIQLEARAARISPDVTGDFLIVEAHVVRVHADPRVVVPGTDHIDPARWSPLIYNFRHYFGLGPELGRSFRSELT